MKCKKIFKQTITITDEDVKYENMKQSFRRLPDPTCPPVPPSTTQAARSSPKVQNEGEVKHSFHPLQNSNSTATSSYPSWTKGSSPEARKHSSSNATRKPEIMRKPQIQAGVAVLPPSPPQAAIPESTSATNPESTYETADLNMAKEWEQVLVRNNDTSCNKCSFYSDNSLSAQSKKSVIADESSEQDELPEMQVIKPGRRQKKINAGLRDAPKLKSLPTIDSLKPPKKPPKPPIVDLSRFLYLHGNNSIQFTGSPEVEKAAAVLSTATYEDSISLSEESAHDDTVDQELPGTRTRDYIASTNGSEFYQDILPVSPYSDNVFDDNPDSGFDSPEAVIKMYTNHWDEQQYRCDEVEYVNCTDALKKKPKLKDGKIDKKQLDFRKKYKISGLENVLYSTSVNEDCKGGKEMLSLKKGDTIAIIQIMNCPMGQWLAKNEEGNYGFIPVSSVNSQEYLIYINKSLQDSQYDDVGHSRELGTSLGASSTSDGYADMSLDVCDVASIKSTGSGGKRKVLPRFFKKDKEKSKETNPRESTGKRTSSSTDSYIEFPNDNDFYATTITEDDKNGAKQEKTKKLSKQEREFRVKFKYTKDIAVVNIAVVTESAPRSAKTKFDLSVKPGEELEVIDITDENKVICRNAAGKYGHVAIERLNFTYNVFS
ncbi:hypothetical protein XELAEV_18023031mg [Xenopus laevis]|nr:hypothetical protein XELAEV_18023031mg [Xenopus laevis]